MHRLGRAYPRRLPGPGPRRSAAGVPLQVNAFTQQVLSPYLNFHRPCFFFFPTEEVDRKGRVRKRYRDADIMTPYEKLKSLPDAAACLKPGTTFAKLDAVAFAMSDNEAAARPSCNWLREAGPPEGSGQATAGRQH